MHGEEKRKLIKTYQGFIIVAGIVILAVAEWFGHRRITFMMDDEWYGTNLVTNQPLRGLSDIIESQIWHFRNWGGRCMTHGILQLTLMSGEFMADMLNMAAFLLLGWMICAAAEWKKPFAFLLSSSLIVALNPNARMSMFWQSGTVNYVYSAVWILAFILPYLRQVKMPEANRMPLADLWILPLGLMAGWSNENMGPACLCVAAGAGVYRAKCQKQKLPAWMISGTVSCLAGSILVVAAPGNFVRVDALEKKAFGEVLYDRFCSMLHAGGEFLFPAAVLVTAVLLLWTVCLKEKLRPDQWMLAALAVLSYGAMVLSPHYPDRAVFGTMTICIVLSLSVLREILKKNIRLYGYIGCMALCYWCRAMWILFWM